MNDLERIKAIEKKLRIELFLAYDVEDNAQNDPFDFGQSRSYNIDDAGNVTALNLDNCSLSSLDDSYLENFKHLKKLSILQTVLQTVQSNYDFLKGLTNLSMLRLSSHYLSNVRFLKGLTNLSTLSLSINYLLNADALQNLTNLSTLSLSGNKLPNVDALKGLTNLSTLDLNGNNLSNADALKNLTNLSTLSLSGNKLADADALKGLTNLSTLDLSGNNLPNADALEELTNLSALNLSGNNLSNADALKNLTNLSTLDLSHNKLADADALKGLTNLSALDLSGNNLSNADALKNLTGLSTLGLSGNEELPNFGISLNHVLQGEEIKKIIKFYEDLDEQGRDYIYEAKILIIGQPRAGKTTLYKKILKPEYMPQEATDEEKRSTLGINIKTFPFNIKTENNEEKEFNSYLWDFGGQDIQYILHQYFLTERSLYVFLYDVGKEDEKTNYWFEIIASLGKDCPVLVVLNYNNIEKSRPGNFAIDTYRKEFADKIKDIAERKIDFSINDGDWDELYQTIKNKVSRLEHIGRDFLPKKTVDVRNLLSGIDEPIIGIDEYYEICDRHEIDKAEADTILTRLHEFGVALWYKDDANLQHKVILKPNWVIDALYVVLKEEKIQKNNGSFHSQTVFDLWENYKTDEKVFLLNLMQKGVFSTVYKLQNRENKYIVPALLSPDKPDEYSYAEETPIQIYFQYEFMPDGIISRLIVELNEKIHSENDKQIVWRKGVLLKENSSFAEVIQSDRNRRITIKISGDKKHDNRELLSEIRRELEKIHEQIFKGRLSVTEYVPCPCTDCRKIRKTVEKMSPDDFGNLSPRQEADLKPENFKFKDLINRINNLNKETIECHKSGKDIIVADLLGEIYIKGRIKGESEFMSGDNYNFYGNNTLFNKELKDNATANQYINSPDNEELDKKLDEMFARLNDTQADELKNLTDDFFKALDEKLAKTSGITEEQTEEFEAAKLSSDLKFKLKVGLPLASLTGVTAEVEKEWKISKEINADGIISSLRKALRHEEFQETKFNQLEENN